MVTWQYAMITADINNPGGLFSKKVIGSRAVWINKDDAGKTMFDEIKDMGDNGWELVSVTPVSTVTNIATTDQLLFTFKRPK